MSVICFPNCIFLSETSRMIAVYRSLQSLEVDVKIATHGGPYDFIFSQHNIPVDIVRPKISKEFYNRFMQSIYDGGRTQNYSLEELLRHVEGELDYFKEVNASVVVSGFTLSARLSAFALNIPLVVTHMGSWTPITYEKYGVIASDYFKNPVTQYLPARWLNAFGTRMFPHIRSYLKVFNEAAHSIGIIPFRSLFDLLLGDHTLITDVPEILGISEREVSEWKAEKNKMVRAGSRLAYAGPIYAQLFGEIPSEVLDFLHTDKPKLYVAMNSGQRRDLKIVYDTIAKMDVRAVLVSTTHEDQFGKAPNILIRSFLPSDKVMPLCDLVIIQGGQGAVQTAIASGVPMVGFPLQPEQNFNLWRIQELGAGKCMSLFDLRRGKLRSVIDDCLKDPALKHNAGELKKLQEKRNGPELTAKYIQGILNSKVNDSDLYKNPGKDP